jgi:hypothetical protein
MFSKSNETDENKKGRFDLESTVQRQKSELQQQLVPINVRRDEGTFTTSSRRNPY